MKRLFSVILLSLFFISKAQQSCYDKANEYRYGKFNFDSIFERIRQSQKMVIGCQLPNDSFTTIQGVKKHIANYWGKPLVINFWYLHCPPCINEIPSFAELDKKYGNKISLIAISQDPKLQVLDFLTKHNFKAEIAADELSFIDKYNLGSGYPFTLIINQEGKIVHIISGGREEIDNQLDLYKEVSPYIDKMLANSEEDEIIPIREVEIDSKPEIIDVCEQMPEYKGGWKELNKFIKSNTNQKNIIDSTGTVIVKFKVDTHGDVQKPSILKGLSKPTNDECLRIVQLLKFSPALQNKKTIPVFMTLPFHVIKNSFDLINPINQKK